MVSRPVLGGMAQKMANTPKGTTTQQDHASSLQDCARVCNETLTYCLEQGGDHVEAEHVTALVDCGQVCNVTLPFVARQSEIAEPLMEACAQACDACAASCEAFEGDETMEACAEACRNCAEACRNV